MSVTHAFVSAEGAAGDPDVVDGVDWNAEHLVEGFGGSTASRLSYAYAGSDLSGQAISASTWTDLVPNQNFTVGSGSSVVEFVLRSGVQAHVTGADKMVATRLLIDGVTPLKMGGWQYEDTNYHGIPGGTGYLTGLSAGSHTVKPQIYINGGAGDFYLRPSASGGAEFLEMQVIENGGGSSSGLLAAIEWRPSVQQNINSTNTTGLDDVDATNAAITFTVPASGAVVVRAEACFAKSSASFWCEIGLKEGSTVIQKFRVGELNAGGNLHQFSHRITGLTPGDSKTYKLGFAQGGSGSTATCHVVDTVFPLRMDVVEGGISVGTAASILDDLTDVDTSSTPATDGQALIWDDTSDLWVPGDVATESSGTGPHELDYVQITSGVSVTATTEAGANTVVTGSAATYDGSTAVVVEFFAPSIDPTNTTAAFVQFWLYDGSTSLGYFGIVRTPSTSEMYVPVHLTRRLTPSAGSHTYSVRASTSSGTSLVDAGAGGTGLLAPAFIRITRATGGVTLGSSPGVSLINSGVQNIGAGATAQLTFDTEEWDTDGFHSTSVNTTRITIPAGMDGKYLLIGNTFGGSPTDDAYAYVGFKKNGAAEVFFRQRGISRGSSDMDNIEFSVLVDAVAGDYYEVTVNNGDSSARDFGHASVDRARSRFQAIRIGGTPTSADEVDFDNADSGLAATSVQEALDEIAEGGHALGFVGASAYPSSTQSLTNGLDTTITHDAEIFDSDGFHSTSVNTSRLTVPAGLGGKYLVIGQLRFASNATGMRLIRIMKNGSGISTVTLNATNGDVTNGIVTSLVDAVAGDYFEMQGYQNSGGALNTGGGGLYATFLSCYKIDTPALGGPPGASITEATAQSFADDTEAAFTSNDAEIFDTDGYHDTGSNTSRMTVPAGLGGKYLVTGSCFWAADTDGWRAIYFKISGTTTENGFVRARSADASVGTYQSTSAVLDLTAGQYVELFGRHTAGGALNGSLTRFSIVRLGGSSREVGVAQSYTPTWTSDGTPPTIGNGTLAGRYRLLDPNLMFLTIRLALGSTSTAGTGTYTFTLPTGYKSLNSAFNQTLACRVLDSSTRHYSATAVLNANGTTMYVVVADTGGVAQWAQTQPFSLANTDEVDIQGVIEVEPV